MFERLVALRLAEGGQMEAAAVAAVIEDNLFGLEIDPRCTQIAAFNLALAAWRHVGYCPLPAGNLACSGLAPNTSESEWLALAGDNERFRNGMTRLYRLFEKAAVLGSLINPRSGDANLLVAGFQELEPLLEQVLAKENKDDEMAVTAKGIAKAAEILAEQFTLIATNVPYLSSQKQAADLWEHTTQSYALSKADLAAVFIERAGFLAADSGSVAIVSPLAWSFLGSYKKLRAQILETKTIDLFARLGAGAFETITGEVVSCALSVISSPVRSNDHSFFAIDASECDSTMEKAVRLRRGGLSIRQADILANPDSRFVLDKIIGHSSLLSEYASAYYGQGTGDFARFGARFWEMPGLTEKWERLQSTVEEPIEFGGRSLAVFWEQGRGSMIKLAEELRARLKNIHERGAEAWGKKGIAVSLMGELPASLYDGSIFDTNCSAVIPNDPQNLLAVWVFLSDDSYGAAVRRIDQSIKVTNATLLKVPFDLKHWQKVAEEKYPNGLPKPYSSDATQWLFNSHPAGADQPLNVAVARLVGYEWPRQTGSSFPDCPALGADGLEELSDEDGIVCLAPVRGEASAVERLRKLLAAAFGDEWSAPKERELLLATAVDNNAKNADPHLDTWLRSSFFSEHCKLFQSRPFIWQIWDGHPHGFSALVNYHKLAAPNGQGRKTLELLAYTYLGDWIDRQKLDQAEGVNGADDRLAAALDLQGQLKKIIEGEPPYDIFVRWKPLHQQAIGWDPDINDGVRLNIRPFLSAQLRKGGKTGAGILRAKPGTIKWAKDRGKEPMRSKGDFPWFWGWDENDHAVATDFGAQISGAPPAGASFDGNRWNDLHYTRAAKEAARARHRGEG
jgi:hypothetical protein